MKISKTILILAACVSFRLASAEAQQAQIPTLQVCNETIVNGSATVQIGSRHGGFDVNIDIRCNPSDAAYPTGTLEISNLKMSDSSIQGKVIATTFEQITSTGTDTPTVYLNGRCRADKVVGCRFWLMIADNKRRDSAGTPDVVGFLVLNGKGQRMAYGTGTVVGRSDLKVAPTSN